MSDIRFDPITGYWVTIAPNRNDRPVEFIPTERIVKRILCPFCAGNELETPRSVASYNQDGERVADDKPWLVRVFANKYPAFSIPGNGAAKASKTAPGNGLYQSMSSHGVQELVIPSSRHLQSLSHLTAEESLVTHIAYRDRIQAASEQDGLLHAMLFLNCRSSAGASMEHIHTQLIAAPVLSDSLSQRMDRNQKYQAANQQHQIHALTEWELAQDERVVDKSANFTVICPFASRFAFQMWIVPNADQPSFQQSPESLLEELAILSQRQIIRLESVLDEPAYNVLFHLPPFAQTDSQPWFVEIFPRITTPAGFELGTDIWVSKRVTSEPNSPARLRINERESASSQLV